MCRESYRCAERGRGRVEAVLPFSQVAEMQGWGAGPNTVKNVLSNRPNLVGVTLLRV